MLADLVGLRFGKLTVLSFSHRSAADKPYWKCVCDCGTQKVISADNLRGGHGTHCGCVKAKNPKFINLTGQRFGRFTVLERVPDYENPNKTRTPMWKCLCDCGREKAVRGYHLRQGKILSCGCYLADNTERRFSKHGLHGTPEEILCRSARGRAKKHGLEFCLDPQDICIPENCPLLGIPIIQNLGRRGPAPNSPSLDRIDSEKGYTKSNVWVISHKANTIKSNATVEELRMIADGLERKNQDVNSNTCEN